MLANSGGKELWLMEMVVARIDSVSPGCPADNVVGCLVDYVKLLSCFCDSVQSGCAPCSGV